MTQLNLTAQSGEDVKVISALLQDSIGIVGEIAWLQKKRRFACVLSRLRREENTKKPDRIRTGLHIDSVMAVKAKGLDPQQNGQAFVVLALEFHPAEDGAGKLNILCAGDAEITLDLECIDMTLSDVSETWVASNLPNHDPK